MPRIPWLVFLVLAARVEGTSVVLEVDPLARQPDLLFDWVYRRDLLSRPVGRTCA